MGDEIYDEALADDQAAQFQLISEAYNSGVEDVINTALIRVLEARRMKSNGMYDLMRSFLDADLESS